MCRALKIPRGLIYYKKSMRKSNTILENKVIEIFKDSKNNYGTRKIKLELENLHNREIIGYSAGKNKSARLVYDAFLKTNYNLSEINIFHTDRGCELIVDNPIIIFVILVIIIS